MEKNSDIKKCRVKNLVKKGQKTLNKVTKIQDYKKQNQKVKGNRKKNNFYYSFLTIVLLICLVQIIASAILNISKTIAYTGKINTMKKIRDDAETRNHQLRKEINEFSSIDSLESIARNNLKMAGDDEVLIIINKEKEKELQSKKKFGLWKNGK